MPVKAHNPQSLFPQYGNYHHGVEVKSGTDILFISGLNGIFQDGETIPDSFEGQAEMIWKHMGAILESAQMNYENIISLKFYLSHPEFDKANMAIRQKYLRNHRCTLTVICCQLLEPKWKVEIEAIAAR